MKAWKHILENENLGVVFASDRKSAERIWRAFYPQQNDSEDFFLEEFKDLSAKEPEGIVWDWNDQLDRRNILERLSYKDEHACPLHVFAPSPCKSCLSWTVCPFNEFTDFTVGPEGLLHESPDASISSADFERRKSYEAEKLEKLRLKRSYWYFNY